MALPATSSLTHIYKLLTDSKPTHIVDLLKPDDTYPSHKRLTLRWTQFLNRPPPQQKFKKNHPKCIDITLIRQLSCITHTHKKQYYQQNQLYWSSDPDLTSFCSQDIYVMHNKMIGLFNTIPRCENRLRAKVRILPSRRYSGAT